MSTFQLTCPGSATFSGTGGSATRMAITGSASVDYSAEAFPVTVGLGGTTPDSSNSPNILVGQSCTASVSVGSDIWGNTFSGTLSNFQWNPTGTTFQQWSPTTPQIGNTPANSQASYENDGPIPATNPTQWYWNDPGPKPTPETVKCTMTGTPPAGQGSPFTLTVTAPMPVNVVVPTWTATGTGGYMQVNTKAPKDSNYEMWAGPTAPMLANGQTSGMGWRAYVYTPTIPAFGTGSLEIVQIVTPSESWTLKTDPPQPGSGRYNNMTGLDQVCPYDPATTESAQPLLDGDTPGIKLTSSTPILASGTDKSSFIDYLLYQPPGSNSKWIALAQFAWSINGSATIPGTGDWADYVKQNGSDQANPDTVSPSGTTNFTGVTGPDFFPSWTRVIP